MSVMIDEAISEAVEETSAAYFWKSAAEQFNDVGLQGVEYPGRVKTHRRSSEGCWLEWDKMSGVGREPNDTHAAGRLG
jgi:hypothetical protein